MKTIFSLIILFLTVSVRAEEPLTFEQFQAEKEFSRQATDENWTFSYDVRQIGQHGMKKADGSVFYGYLPKASQGPIHALGVEKRMRSFKLSDFGKKLWKTMNQGNCGSCVVFSFTLNFMNALILHGIALPESGLSPQHLMNCGTGGQCNGAYGEGIAGDLVKLGKLHAEKDYPYTASSGRCQQKPGELYGKIAGFKTIDGSPQSILAALHDGYPVSAGVAVDGAWSAYKGGVYNRAGSMGTNHYIDIEGVDCESSVDSEGYCVFDKDGDLPNGVGTFLVHNSWGSDWGQDGGYMVTKITSSSGKRINNIAGGDANAQILDIGIPMPDEKPVSFDLENYSAKLSVTVQPGSEYGADGAKKALENALRAVGN